MHLILYMYKQKQNISIINTRDVCLAHDVVLFLFERSNSEKYQNNVLFKGAVLWNALSVEERKIQMYESMKSYLKTEIFHQTGPDFLIQ